MTKNVEPRSPQKNFDPKNLPVGVGINDDGGCGVQGGEADRLGRLASLSIADMSPKLALQRILNLWQGKQYREAAAFLR